MWCLAVLLVLAGAAAAAAGPPEAEVAQGRLSGLWEATLGGRRIAAFLGIPYGKPPAGKYRFAESVAAGHWDGSYAAVHQPSACMQYSHETYTTKFAVYGSEDCLYLNVYTPKIPEANSTVDLMDVVVYIHGGAFMFHYGGSHGPRYLLDRDLVLVTIQYRVGPLGFLSTEDEVVPGNNGLKDQVLALKWIRDNIAAFGGNPQGVVIAGTSAGGASVHYHFLSPMSTGLFKGGHSMSGASLCPWARAEGSREKAARLAAHLGCPTNHSRTMVSCLRTRPASHIVSAVKIFMPWMYNPFSPFGPIVEGPSSVNPFLSVEPLEALEAGAVAPLPWLASFTTHEGLYPAAEIVNDPLALEELDSRWDELAPHLLDVNWTAKDPVAETRAARERYLGATPVAEAAPQLIQMLGDWLFVAPISVAAKLQSKTGPVYSYLFSYRGKHSASEAMAKTNKDFGTSHADDTGYIFDREDMNPEEDLDMQNMMIDMFESFVKTGVPKWKGGGEWPGVVPEGVAGLRLTGPAPCAAFLPNDHPQLSFWYHLIAPPRTTKKEEL